MAITSTRKRRGVGIQKKKEEEKKIYKEQAHAIAVRKSPERQLDTY